MEKVNLFILAALAMVMTHCQENTAQPGDDCSIELAGIHFTRSLNDAAGNTTVENGRLRIRGGAKTDFFNDPNGELTNSTAPLLLTKVDNTKPFTFTTKVTPEFVTTYDAGALYIFTSARLWQKFAFEQDEQKRSRIVSVRTIQTSDDNNHDIITQESVHLRISSDTETVAFYYSTDSTSWNLARLYKNNFPETIWLGLSAQSPVGDGSAAYFEDCSLTYSKTELSFVGRYYFSDNKLIDLETTGHNRFEDDTMNIEKVLITESNENVQKLQKSMRTQR